MKRIRRCVSIGLDHQMQRRPNGLRDCRAAAGSGISVRYTPNSVAVRRPVVKAGRRRNRIESAVMPGMTTRQPSHREPTAAPYTMSLQGFDRVRRTRRMETAMRPEKRAQGISICLNDRDQNPIHPGIARTTRRFPETLPDHARARGSDAARSRGHLILPDAAGMPRAPGV